jgi:pimeloyl-ACP methyl ester carboxylesterase
MKSIFKKGSSSLEGMALKLPRILFLLPILTAIIFACYVIILRPYLMPSMATVPVELVVAISLILAAAVSILTILSTLLIMLVIAVLTRNQVRTKCWLLKLRRQMSITVTLILALAVFAVCTHWMAYTPPILGDNGKPLAGSIAALEKVNLNGSKQWITIRGRNKNNPVLLFLAGGPGGSQMAATRNQLKSLEEHFVVVNWDQPGAGKSYHALPLKALTAERYISDAYELTKYLCSRFNQEKIYVVGESWGSALGIWLAQSYPELIHAFVGTGQMVAFSDTEVYCYEKALEIANERGDIKKIEELKAQGVPPYYGKDMVWKESAYLMYLSDFMVKNPEITNSGYNTLGDMAAPEYGLYDKINYARGVVTTFNHVYQQLYDFDLRKQAVKIDVPVYFMEGRFDINAPTALVEEYYKILNAPSKKFIWFETSGHSPWINERDKFVDSMVNLVLKETKH